MERLTTIEQGCCIACFECNDKNDDCGCPEIDKCLHRLRDYEDTGLTPREIMNGKMLTGWVPVEERLPKEDGLYVVTIMGVGIAGPIYMRDLTDYENESGWYARNVVAWLPCKLPKPYRPELLKSAT